MRTLASIPRLARRLDPFVLGPIALLVLMGVFLIDSADLVGAALAPQLKWLLCAVLVGPVVLLVPYPKILKLAPLFYLAGLLSLALVLVLGTTINGARRWLPIGGLSFQPSEVMKFATVLALARWLKSGRALTEWRELLVPIGLAVLPVLLIIQQPDLGTSLLFFPLAAVTVFIAGVSTRRIVQVLLVGLVLGGAFYFVGLEDYQRERIWSTYNLERMTAAQRAGPGYQLDQSLLAIGNGGVFGHGHGDGPRTQSGKLPYQHSDFVFSVLAEEHGFFGGVVVLGLYVVLVLAIFRVARRSRDPSGRVLCVGIGTLIGAQAFIHCSVTLGLLPTKGLPLPLVSAGGTSLFVTLCGLLLVQNVALHPHAFPVSTRGGDFWDSQ